jgi:hypothetical protein
MKCRSPTRALAVTMGVPLLLALSSCGPQDTLPPLLRNLEARGVYANACPVPPDLKAAVARLGLADSPELDRRLNVEFPTGTPESKLVLKLHNIGFRTLGHCKGDQTISIVRYDQAAQPNVFLFFPMTATIFWKVDKNGNIIWSKGFVFYTGP